jgi:hypothetical protein
MWLIEVSKVFLLGFDGFIFVARLQYLRQDGELFLRKFICYHFYFFMFFFYGPLLSRLSDSPGCVFINQFIPSIRISLIHQIAWRKSLVTHRLK